MPFKVLNEHLVYAIRSRWVAAGISHGAPTAIEILPHYHRNFPQSWIRSRGTGWYHTVVEQFIIQRIRPARRSVLIDGHGGVVREICVPEHLEHVVPADLNDFYTQTMRFSFCHIILFVVSQILYINGKCFVKNLFIACNIFFITVHSKNN